VANATQKPYQRVRGLLLAQDPSFLEDLHVVSGRNFMPRLEGPETCFASDLLTNGNADFGIYVDLFRHNGHSIIISERGVWSVDNNCHMTSCMTFSCKETKSCANDFCYPWSHAYVGETHYYAHPAVGIVAFDTFTNEWKV